ncbi:TIGR03668 family PPOX class F420-dependent oxidoreductase [Gordonia rubripertincta]|uniref:TIGR03668 family PPOX class F420-dependent oxidoreductase n=1 Tax=Gordonia rubripertincta TaxID=36822 RepID=A0ABT4N004_GORRU|nr:TIGR03668 family PPOX class F420-dependent oxidoreductase [Gordonia rubripertincta]MCZ4552593.1 TIGR03668 family PPOX class F420-dependent oxidoreductase [Gordonia rubripertincta]
MDETARTRFIEARSAVLATVVPEGGPHLVPIVFAIEGDVVYTAVDGKPKSTTRLRRLANIEAQSKVSVLVDHYDDDWEQLWWVRADGVATVHTSGERADRAREMLRAKYDQYESVPLEGPAIAIAVTRWSSWSYSG